MTQQIVLSDFGGRHCTATLTAHHKGRSVPAGPTVRFDEPASLNLAQVEYLLAKMRELAQ